MKEFTEENTGEDSLAADMALGDRVSPRSRMDYIAYHVMEKQRILLLIMETKFHQRRQQLHDAIAQVCVYCPVGARYIMSKSSNVLLIYMQAIGYLTASRCDHSNPPVLCVLAAESMHLIIFPFHTSSKDGDITRRELLLNAVSIPFARIDESSALCLLALAHDMRKAACTLEYTGEYAVKKTSFAKTVKRSEDEINKSVIAELKNEIARLQSKLKNAND
ncbi:MAG: hypothetical protein MPL62_16585 [Alphaproteobacteria bacterium]|nr:hypothetical protein [Alphaproteobacteria bacterium]